MSSSQQITQELAQISNALHQEYSNLERFKGEENELEKAVDFLKREVDKISTKYKEKQRDRGEELRRIQLDIDKELKAIQSDIEKVQSQLNVKTSDLQKIESEISQVTNETKKLELKRSGLEKSLKNQQNIEAQMKLKK